MQAIFETLFDIVYLVGVITLGILMIVKSKGDKQYRLSGIMAVVFMSIIQIILCLFPQNVWTSADTPLSWGIYRNIPFTIMGLLIIILFYKSTKEANDILFQRMSGLY